MFLKYISVDESVAREIKVLNKQQRTQLFALLNLKPQLYQNVPFRVKYMYPTNVKIFKFDEMFHESDI